MPGKTPKKPIAERILDADVRCRHWLAEGNAAAEDGEHVKAQACYDKSQYWLDRYNFLSGRSDRDPPKC